VVLVIYTNIDQQIELVLTTQCNWKCTHCTFGTFPSYNHVTEQQLHQHLPYICNTVQLIEKCSVCLVGGEIGLLDERLLHMVFYYLSNWNIKPIISTNGEYLKRNYHKRYESSHIFCHMHDGVNECVANVSYGKVFNCAYYIEEFLQKNKHMPIDYLGFDFPLSLDITEMQLKTCYTYLLECAKQYQNITAACIEDIERKIAAIPSLDMSRKACATLNQTVSIVLPENKIAQCSGRSNNSIDLTEDNLIKILTPHSNMFGDNEYCKSCFAWCAEKNLTNILNTKIRNAKTL